MSLDPGQSGEVAAGPGAKGSRRGGAGGAGRRLSQAGTHTHTPRTGPALSSQGRRHLSRMFSPRPAGVPGPPLPPGAAPGLEEGSVQRQSVEFEGGNIRVAPASCPVWASGSSPAERLRRLARGVTEGGLASGHGPGTVESTGPPPPCPSTPEAAPRQPVGLGRRGLVSSPRQALSRRGGRLDLPGVLSSFALTSQMPPPPLRSPCVNGQRQFHMNQT